MGDTVIVQDLHIRFGEVHAVRGLSFRVRPGEVYGLLGPNGAGKTTTLRTLVGLLIPERGKVLIEGFDPIAHREEVLRRTGVVMANAPLPDTMTGREALRYYGAFYDIEDLDERIDRLASDLEMPYLDREIAGYSTGMRQRLSIARALLHEPKLLILDEATNGLDVWSRIAVLDLVRRLRERGTAVIYSTHILAEAEAICDRVGIIERGRMVAEGTVPELLARTGERNLELAYIRLASQSPEEVRA